MTQALVRPSQLDPCGIAVYNGNRPKGKARGIGYSSGSSRLSIPVGVLSWRQRLWPDQSLTLNTLPTGTTFGVHPTVSSAKSRLVKCRYRSIRHYDTASWRVGPIRGACVYLTERDPLYQKSAQCQNGRKTLGVFSRTQFAHPKGLSLRPGRGFLSRTTWMVRNSQRVLCIQKR